MCIAMVKSRKWLLICAGLLASAARLGQAVATTVASDERVDVQLFLVPLLEGMSAVTAG